MVVLGLLLGLAGTDVMSGSSRFTMGIPEMSDGINFVVVAMGILASAKSSAIWSETQSETVKIARSAACGPRAKNSAVPMPILRGTALARSWDFCRAAARCLPPLLPMRWKRRSRARPEEFGHGAIEGVAGRRVPNNAGAQTSFIPMLTLGIPSNPIMGLMIGAMIIQGIQPGRP